MYLTSPIIKKLLKRKIATAVFISASIAAFATLGDGGKKNENNSVIVYNYSKTFSLRSGFNYKSNNIFNTPENKTFIMLNTVVTYQKGNATYVMPLKKKVLVDKVKFNSSPFKF